MDQEEPKYPSNVLEAFGTGALLDFRVRMAFNLLAKSPMFAGLMLAQSENSGLAKAAAALALGVADEVLRQGAAAGWVESLPEATDVEIGEQLRAQAKRTAAYGVLQQMAGQEFLQHEQAGRVIPVAPGGPRGH